MDEHNSYLRALGLVRIPFPFTPDAGSYYTTPYLEEQLVELEHCVLARKGFCLLTAEVGMGKSTLVRRLINELSSHEVESALVFNTFLQGAELLAAVLRDFGLDSSGSMAEDIARLNDFLVDNHRQGKTCLLVIDDAQNLSPSSLELIRLLCNLETDQEKLLQILLAGQPELEETLAQHSLRQLRSRVVKHVRLHGLSRHEISDYVRFRFETAGGDGSVALAPDACDLLWEATQGVPRKVHLIMDRCLYGLSSRDTSLIYRDLVMEAIADVQLPPMDEAVHTLPAKAPANTRRPWVMATVALFVVAGGAALALQPQIRAAGQPMVAVAPTANQAPTEASVTKQLTAQLLAQAPTPVTAPEPQVAPVLAEPVALAAAPATETPTDATEPPAPQRSCESDLVATTGQVKHRQVIGDALQEKLGTRLASLKHACLERHAGAATLIWHADRRPSPAEQRFMAAQLQIALTNFGSLDKVGIDGIWGDRSREALRRFQETLGLEPTGEADALSVLLLESFYVQAI